MRSYLCRHMSTMVVFCFVGFDIHFVFHMEDFLVIETRDLARKPISDSKGNKLCVRRTSLLFTTASA